MFEGLNKKILIDPKDSTQIKAALFRYFRFYKNMHCVTETNVLYRDIEDFVAFKGKEVYCVEIKTDKQDFLNDFKIKEKHRLSPRYDKFYFCVPEEMADFVEKYIKQYPRYGVIVVTPSEVKVTKRATRDNSKEFNPYFTPSKERYLFKRLSSELANEKMKPLLVKKENNATKSR
jgi:hypothetical protein